MMKLQKKFKLQGFTLVEVTLAMGIIAFALLSVMALMPVGLSTMRAAMDQTSEAQIVRQLGGEILLTPFSEIPGKYQNKRFYFDEEGNREEDQTAQSRHQTVLTVVNASYPGFGKFPLANSETNSLTTVRIEIITPARGGPGSATNTYHLRVPNSGG